MEAERAAAANVRPIDPRPRTHRCLWGGAPFFARARDETVTPGDVLRVRR